jgi:hypothetical protein
MLSCIIRRLITGHQRYGYQASMDSLLGFGYNGLHSYSFFHPIICNLTCSPRSLPPLSLTHLLLLVAIATLPRSLLPLSLARPLLVVAIATLPCSMPPLSLTCPLLVVAIATSPSSSLCVSTMHLINTRPSSQRPRSLRVKLLCERGAGNLITGSRN